MVSSDFVPAHLMRALPPYPGRKSRLIPAIFGLIASVTRREDWASLTFADAFLGSGAVGLSAKALGFGTVLANDLAARSTIVGRALIENSSRRLSMPEALRLFAEPVVARSAPAIAEKVPPPMDRFVTTAHAHILGGTYEGVVRDLVATLLIRSLLRCFPLSLPTASDASRVAKGDFDGVTGPRLAHYLKGAERLGSPTAILASAQRINAAIIPGRASVTQLDALEWLPTIEADVVDLDPPYGGTQSYERAFALIDDFLGADALPVSRFSGRRPPLDDLLDACRHIPVLVLSMGNAVFDEQSLTELVGHHRDVRRVLSIPFRHYGALATSEKNARNREFLVLATKGRSG
jgi:16S rRNA G966 N2-methylase RsmD